jgi:hypothetical protein
MFWDVEVTPEEEDAIIRKTAEKIHQYGMDVIGIMLLETIKPMTFIGTTFGRFFLSPYLPALGKEIDIGGEKLFQIFEKRDNVEKLIVLLEEMAYEEREPDKKSEEPEETAPEEEYQEEEREKKGWRRFLPF